MMRRMRSNDVNMSDDFEPAPLAIGPDGGIAVTAEAKIIPPPPRLCEAGPCVNYHRFVTQLDAEAPIGQALERGGKIIGMPEGQPFHTETHHYCYPTVGIETNLGALPVLECNRWEPNFDVANAVRDDRRKRFLESDAGKAFADARAAWVQSVNAPQNEVDEIQTWITMNLREGDSLCVTFGIHTCVYQTESARSVTTATIREKFGAGNYELSISRYADPNDATSASTIHTKTIEVT